ncbi:MAG: cytochrome c oxidase assembly protein [Nocardioidaceae bacterium]
MPLPMTPWSWSLMFTTWQSNLGWDVLVVAVFAAYVGGLAVVRRRRTGGLAWWRIMCMVLGLGALVVTVNSALETYSHSLFWVHMVQHLLLIMVVPALVIAGHPLTLLVQVTPARTQRVIRSILSSRAVAVITHPLVALGLYTVIIVGTHLTSFMQQMLTHMWLHHLEFVLYLVGGYLFLLPLLGDEPIRWRLPYPARMVVLFIAMAPDTVVGLVLLQTNHALFPAYAAMHRAWGPSLVQDIQTGGGIMWVFGDGLMMCFIVAVMIGYLANSGHNATAGAWLESVRHNTLVHNLGGVEVGDGTFTDANADPDDDDATLAAYNEMLRRLKQRDG